MAASVQMRFDDDLMRI